MIYGEPNDSAKEDRMAVGKKQQRYQTLLMSTLRWFSNSPISSPSKNQNPHLPRATISQHVSAASLMQAELDSISLMTPLVATSIIGMPTKDLADHTTVCATVDHKQLKHSQTRFSAGAIVSKPQACSSSALLEQCSRITTSVIPTPNHQRHSVLKSDDRTTITPPPFDPGSKCLESNLCHSSAKLSESHSAVKSTHHQCLRFSLPSIWRLARCQKVSWMVVVWTMLVVCCPTSGWCKPATAYQHTLSSTTLFNSHYHRHDRHYPFERAQLLQQQHHNITQQGNVSCPNCGVKLDRPQAEKLKLSAIKQQILSKLNLEAPPEKSSNRLSRDEALEIVRKARLDAIRDSRRSNRSKRRRHNRRHSGDHTQVITLWRHNQSLPDNMDFSDQDYDNLEDNEFADEYFGKTSEIIVFAEPGRRLNGHTLVELVPPQDNLHKLSISSAVLWVRLMVNRRLWNQMDQTKHEAIYKKPVTLYVFKVANQTGLHSNAPQPVFPTPFFKKQSGVRNDTYNERISFELLNTYRMPNQSRHGWVKIDLTKGARTWFREAAATAQRLTLLIDCAGCNKLFELDLSHYRTVSGAHKHPRSTVQESNWDTTPPGFDSTATLYPRTDRRRRINKMRSGQARRTGATLLRSGRRGRHLRPFLVITTRTRLRRRSRRHAYNCEDGIRQCCKQSLYVDFSELGWDDWILYPKGYTANYCMGECVQMRTPDMLAYFHSHVLEEYRIKNPYASITPCCAPTKLSPISLIYFDQEGHIIKADLPKMVVDECGCT